MKSGVQTRVRFTLNFVIALGLALTLGAASSQAQSWQGRVQPGEYNMGPDPRDPMQKELIDIFASLPEYHLISDAIMDQQKFRYYYGLMMTRAYFEKNSIKILFIGQDATHIAEAAKEPGTSGFGGRVQNMGNYLGVDEGIATTNAYLSTIQGQYGSRDHMYVEVDATGTPQIRQTTIIDNRLWTITHNPESEIRKTREKYWEWVIKNNPDSLQLIATFGGAAQDSFAEFLIARGVKMKPKIAEERFKRIRVPESKIVPAGGNNTFAVLIDKDGNDIYQKILGRKVDYANEADQKAAVEAVKNGGQKAIDMMVFSNVGLHNSGVLSAAQLGGGWDLNTAEINGVRLNSLKGLVLSDGYTIERHIGFIESAHPTYLSMQPIAKASELFNKSLEPLKELLKLGWRIAPDKGMVNRWEKGDPFEYSRSDIRPGYFPFGAPDDRRGARADAKRLDKQTIVVGDRDVQNQDFNGDAIKKMKKATPSEAKDPNDLWANRPRTEEGRVEFSRGPGKRIAAALESSLNRDEIFALKPGFKQVLDSRTGDDISFQKYGIDAYNTKTHPGTGFFGYVRGSFETSKALILADPIGLDDWISDSALTGERGQHLNRLMDNLGFGEDYLVIKSVPFGMDGATAEEWAIIRKQTENYREVAISEALKNKNIEMIFTDGAIAQAEMKRVLSKLKVSGIQVVDIKRDPTDLASGIAQARDKVAALGGKFANAKTTDGMLDIPRSHLPWWSRTWEGTSGDRVIDALGKKRGGVRAVVLPDWVKDQEIVMRPEMKKSIDAMTDFLTTARARFARETIPDYAKRLQLKSGLQEKMLADLKPKTKAGERRLEKAERRAAGKAAMCAAGAGQ